MQNMNTQYEFEQVDIWRKTDPFLELRKVKR